MAKPNENTFIQVINNTTGEEIYQIQFDYGVRTIQVTEGTKITLDYVHGGFEEAFSRAGDDLIIGDDWYVAVMQPLGIGYGKELWFVTENEDSTYTIEVSKYSWAGCSYGYADEPRSTETRTMTADELAEFQTEHNVTVNVGANTLYTTWPVLPDPNIYYHMQDCGFYAPANGKIILKDYFKYGKDTIFVGDRLLSDIIKNNKQFAALLKTNSKKPYNIYDTFFDETLYGGDRADKIYSSMGDDTIEGGKGNDKIYLGEGDKTIVLAQGDGKDTVYGVNNADSVNFSVDADRVYFTKSGNNLILNRDYYDSKEQTVIKDYFKNMDKSGTITVSNGDEVLVSDFTKGITEGGAYLKATGKKVIRGTDFNDEAYSSAKNETFILGKGNDIIHFENDGLMGWSPYQFGKDVIKIVEGTHLTLDLKNTGSTLSYERRGNDAVITGRHHIELCGRSTGKEEWVVKKNSDGSYTVKKQSYYFTGSGFASHGSATTETMTADELKSFQKEHNVTVKVGKNTLYTSWAVVPNPIIHYSMTDSSNWGMFMGEIVLKDYFKYREDSVYIGDVSLQQYFKDEVITVDKSKSKKSLEINDSFYDEIIKGGKKADRITSYYGDDTITAGKGDDKIILANGNKTININKGDGNDTLVILRSNDSTEIVFDKADSLSFDRDGNDMLIIRNYGKKSETTIIDNYFKRNLENKITVTAPDFTQELSPDLVGLTMDIICKYRPVDKPFPVDWTVTCPSPSVNEVMQEVSAWQSAGGDVVVETTAPVQYDDIPNLVPVQ